VFEPKLTDSHPDSLKTYPQKVICAQRNWESQVVVANWPLSEEGRSDWRVIDCSLLPTGAVHCGMDPDIPDRILQTGSFRFRDVVCANKDKVAKIAAAKLQMDESEWSVVECSLEAGGEVKCAMSCLLRDPEFSSG
jgi:hypothetical protein